jgi:hypothetical protein
VIQMPEVIDMLLAKTEPGPVSEWTERIAAVARAIELPLCNIEWNGTPKQVAYSLVGYSFRYFCSHDPLVKYLRA